MPHERVTSVVAVPSASGTNAKTYSQLIRVHEALNAICAVKGFNNGLSQMTIVLVRGQVFTLDGPSVLQFAPSSLIVFIHDRRAHRRRFYGKN